MNPFQHSIREISAVGSRQRGRQTGVSHFVRLKAVLAFPVLAISILPSTGQIDGALVTRRGALVQGTVEGALVVLEQTADVAIARGAVVSGDLVVPVEKSPAQPGTVARGASDAFQPKLSSGARVTLFDSASLRGRQKLAAGFDLPQVEKPRQPAGTEARILQSATGDNPDFGKIRDLTVKHRDREVVVPPGAYGEWIVESGRVVLGRKGSLVWERYFFQSLSVGVDAAIELLGPVVIVVGRLDGVQGRLGNERYVNWLDLRVAAGAVALGAGGEVYGVVTAADSAVTLGGRAKLRGGLVCDSAVVEPAARFTGVSPDWSRESSGNSLPLFIHKAARVQRLLPELEKRFGDRYAIKVGYPDDVPAILLEERSRPPDRLAQHEERQAFFAACRTLLEGTGFARGVVMLVRAPVAAGSGPEFVSVTMEREQFEDHLWAIGREPQLRDNVVRIRENPLLLNLFMERCLRVARHPAGVR